MYNSTSGYLSKIIKIQLWKENYTFCPSQTHSKYKMIMIYEFHAYVCRHVYRHICMKTHMYAYKYTY